MGGLGVLSLLGVFPYLVALMYNGMGDWGEMMMGVLEMDGEGRRRRWAWGSALYLSLLFWGVIPGREEGGGGGGVRRDVDVLWVHSG